ncbi:MDR/zinc-dependent alcohol dehydrogenase-like family protein [Paenibacillus oceani]|uniref:Uncharacterized protein n=1 Tax=Paenibacillus oceani TaxID=2772510 RepID=A0A927H013_9BACL|nr:hypothetical protein [Paenibacillus oceani]MBD2863225.1 hypothetical protein [Paenibacillus oceani]
MVLWGKATAYLGNSGVGIVTAKGSQVRHLEVGQRVACYGVPAHAEYYSVPKLLAAPVPEQTGGREAAFAGLRRFSYPGREVRTVRFVV